MAVPSDKVTVRVPGKQGGGAKSKAKSQPAWGRGQTNHYNRERMTLPDHFRRVPALFPRLFAVIAWLVSGAAVAAESWPIRFTDVAESSKVKGLLVGMMGHGGAIGDFDGDGRLDLFAGGFCDRPDAEYAPASGPVPARLLRQREDRTFEIIEQPAVSFHARTSGAVFADLDNDGTLELYVANNARPKAGTRGGDIQKGAQTRRSSLLRMKDGKWYDVSETSGACPPALLSARNIGVFDYDGDGKLDLLIVEDRFVPRGVTPRTTLLRNTSDKSGLKFEDVSAKVGLPDGVFGLGCAVADVNEDGKPDFFVAHSNRLFLSTLGGKFVESPLLVKTFAWQPLDGEDWPCGAAFGDLDRDGDLDLVVSIHSVKARNRIYLNEGVKDGVPIFRDVSTEAGLGDIVPVRCPHVEIQDFDNDGWSDIYVSAAWRHEDGRVEPVIYRNTGVKDGTPRFTLPRKLGDGDGLRMVYYPAGPTGDINGDGLLDIFLINWFGGDHAHLLRNDSTSKNWLDVRVTGKTKFNRMGIGARVRLFRAGQPHDAANLLGTREISTGFGYASGQPAQAHFGLGDVTRIDVQVMLPGGDLVVKKDVATNRAVVIEEP